MQQTFYLATNEVGNICGDVDRQTAVDRLESEYGGELITISVLHVTVPRPEGYLASIVVRDEIDDTYIHRI